MFKRNSQQIWTLVAALNGALGVAMGAVAAHTVPDSFFSSLAEKASLYQLLHAIAILALADKAFTGVIAARWLFVLGVCLFSGALYAAALTENRFCLIFAPWGGSCLILGWSALVIGLLIKRGEL